VCGKAREGRERAHPTLHAPTGDGLQAVSESNHGENDILRMTTTIITIITITTMTNLMAPKAFSASRRPAPVSPRDKYLSDITPCAAAASWDGVEGWQN
jgi:hypothetical protein